LSFGVGGGSGVLNLHGKNYPFNGKGASLGGEHWRVDHQAGLAVAAVSLKLPATLKHLPALALGGAFRSRPGRRLSGA